MTMKSTLIMPMALLAALAAGVLVHDRLRTKSFAQDAAPTRTASIATATPAVRRCEPAARFGHGAARTRASRTGSDANRIDCDATPAAPAPAGPNRRGA